MYYEVTFMFICKLQLKGIFNLSYKWFMNNSVVNFSQYKGAFICKTIFLRLIGKFSWLIKCVINQSLAFQKMYNSSGGVVNYLI